ncbi:MAG: glycosyltransferase [Desulfobulbaceae bacterium]|nr:glycosyltransferase [Desulfobulbaceae bacterium]
MIAFLAALVFLFNLYVGLDIILGTRKMRNLGEIKPLAEDKRPSVSVIVPACNEEDTIKPALLSLLSLEYAPLEVIVVNDRSTDRTGEVLAEIQGKYPQLVIHTITELPGGWLGKNHALQQGAGLAGGEYLLFTDADIHFAPSTLARAMTLMVGEQVDHLSLIFRNIARGLLLNAMMIDAGSGLFFLFKPWKAGDPESRFFIGVGAFNLIRKSVYFRIGGHKQLKMHPIDDIMLGKIIKRSGFRQECLAGYDFLQVHWYETPGKMVSGLMKNIFALYNYHVSFALAVILLLCLTAIAPFWGVFFFSGITRIFCLLSMAARLISAACGARLTGASFRTVPFSLLTPYINIYITLKGMFKTLVNRGIDWRGTHYPLAGLKENRPILSIPFLRID